MVREVGKRLYNCKIVIDVLERTSDISTVIKGAVGHTFKEYVKFELTISAFSDESEGDAGPDGTVEKGRFSVSLKKLEPT